MPSYFHLKHVTNELVDNTNYLQLLGATHSFFYNHDFDFTVLDSRWKNFPTAAKPYDKYKFFSFALKRDSDFNKI